MLGLIIGGLNARGLMLESANHWWMHNHSCWLPRRSVHQAKIKCQTMQLRRMQIASSEQRWRVCVQPTRSEKRIVPKARSKYSSVLSWTRVLSRGWVQVRLFVIPPPKQARYYVPAIKSLLLLSVLCLLLNTKKGLLDFWRPQLGGLWGGHGEEGSPYVEAVAAASSSLCGYTTSTDHRSKNRIELGMIHVCLFLRIIFMISI